MYVPDHRDNLTTRQDLHSTYLGGRRRARLLLESSSVEFVEDYIRSDVSSGCALG